MFLGDKGFFLFVCFFVVGLTERLFKEFLWGSFHALLVRGFSSGSPASSRSAKTCVWGETVVCLSMWLCDNLAADRGLLPRSSMTI